MTPSSRRPRRPKRSFWERAALLPPIIVRLLAKQTGYRGRGLGRPLTTAELAQATGLSEYQITAISQQLDWTGIDLPTCRKFTTACGIDFEDASAMKRVTSYLAGKTVGGHHLPPRFEYLRQSPDWPTLYQPLITRFFQLKRKTGEIK